MAQTVDQMLDALEAGEHKQQKASPARAAPTQPKSVDQMLSQAETQTRETQAKQDAPWYQQAGQAAGEFMGGAAAGPVSTATHALDWVRSMRGLPPEYTDPAKSPTLTKLATPPPTAWGRAGFGTEQMAEQVGLAAALPEVEGAGLAWAAARMGTQALTSGLLTGAQTGSTREAVIGAGLGAAGGAAGEFARIKAPQAAERAMAPFPQKVGLAEREEIARRAVQPGSVVPMTKAEVKAGFPSLEPEIARHKALVDQLTKDPASIYSQRSLPIDQVLQPVDRYIARLKRVDPEAANALASKRAGWAEELGYRPATPATPARQVPTGLVDPQGNPMMRTVPGTAGTPGQTTTTVAEVQKLKELFRNAIPAGARGEGAPAAAATKGRLLAERGMKRAVEGAIPTIKDINHVIERDLRLKEAITRAVKRNPQWLTQSLGFVAGEAGLEVANRLVLESGGREGRGRPGALTAAEIATGAAALASLASRNPRNYSRLLVMLRRGGGIPAGLGSFLRSETEPEAPPAGPEQYEELESPSAPAPAAGPSTRRTNPSAAGPASPRAQLTPNQLGGMLAEASRRHGVPLDLLRTVARMENASRDPNAVSPKGAIGIMQVMPATGRAFGADDLSDPHQNVEAGARYLRYLWDRYGGDRRKVLAAYNAGPGAVDRYGGVPPYKETQGYVERGLTGAR